MSLTRRSFLVGASLLTGAVPLRALRQGAGQPLPLRAAPRAAGVRVGVFGLFHPTAMTARSGGVGALTLSAGQYTSTLQGHDAAHLRIENGAIRIELAGGVLHAPSLRIAGVADDTGLALDVPEKIARTFLGRAEIAVVSGELIPIVVMDLETAVASVVAAEQIEATPRAALEAQAVAARSYFTAASGRHRRFDFCDTTHCQFLREPPRASHPAAHAARVTSGLVLSFRGAAVAALYSASCGGRTRSLAEAGLGGAEGYPFFAVECAFCAGHAPEWQTRLPRDAAAERLAGERSEAARLAIARRDGWSAVPGNNFETSTDGNRLLVRGRGIGHGIGMCQAGAADLARQGADFVQILQHYYPGTTLESPAG